MKKYTAEDFISQASGQYLTEYVESIEDVTEDILWEPIEHWLVDDVCDAIHGTAQLIADCVNKALEE